MAAATRIAAGIAIALTALSGVASAADLDTATDPIFSKTSLYRPDHWEVRTGGFAHAVGSGERGSADFNFEVVTPQFFTNANWPAFMTPRFQLGGTANLARRTSNAYIGMVFTQNFAERFFVEPFFGIAVTNGSVDGDATHNALGCTTLIHAGGNAGYRIDAHWSVMFTFDHISNANLCSRNVGVSDYGARVGYNF